MLLLLQERQVVSALALRGVHVVMGVTNMASGKEAKEATVKEIPTAKIEAMDGIGPQFVGIYEEVCIGVHFIRSSSESPHVGHVKDDRVNFLLLHSPSLS
ncbi:hypothetical protein RHGRI_030546 [Rhododendron griersonianum]|uniref:Uncharacterized protein n=1 Tax=Rhododendron griersonianum TaxID=479676 RepID=A0AAV6ISY8_9ERIC|nr:hypothetical protein RHGRI_030546 [Rhododendron griersonianum]